MGQKIPQILLPPKPKVIRKNRCQNCGYSQLMRGADYECHRGPPAAQAFPVQSQQAGQPNFMIHTCHPIVKDIDWCGEWKAKLDS